MNAINNSFKKFFLYHKKIINVYVVYSKAFINATPRTIWLYNVVFESLSIVLDTDVTSQAGLTAYFFVIIATIIH